MTRKTTIHIWLLVLVIAGAVAGMFVFRNKSPTINRLPRVSRSVPDAVLKGVDGGGVKLSDFRGKAMVISFWASWCSLCTDELKQLDSVQKSSIRGDGGVVFIAINRGESVEQVQKIIQEFGVGASVVILLDNDDGLYQALGGFAMPETLFIDKNGVIQEHRRGSMTTEELRRRMQDLKKLSTDS